jgi:hypothetical protein
VRIAYGPPGHQGVTTLMSVGAADDLGGSRVVQLADTAGDVAVALWLVGLATGNRTLGRAAFWGGLAAWGVGFVARRRR